MQDWKLELEWELGEGEGGRTGLESHDMTAESRKVRSERDEGEGDNCRGVVGGSVPGRSGCRWLGRKGGGTVGEGQFLVSELETSVASAEALSWAEWGEWGGGSGSRESDVVL